MGGRPAVLVVDDDESTRTYLEALVGSFGYPVECFGSGARALARLEAGSPPPGVMLLDLLMPEMDGLVTLDEIRRSHPRLPVIVLTTVQQLRTVVEAMRRGATDYLTKPFGDRELEVAIESAVKARCLTPPGARRAAPTRTADSGGLLAGSPAMRRIRDIALQVADTDAPVLLLGESGVGKEVVARFIHEQSSRSAKAFVKVNCAALPHDLLESELFGYERGAFSGATGDKPGQFELAHKGTILLDEIGDMSPHLQAKILHVLQDGRYTRLGGRQPLHSDARVLASTNRPLEELLGSDRFREDLYFRLDVIRLEIPPLRERPEDLPLLAQHFLQRYQARYPNDLRELPEELRAAFARYPWPGNVRELENVIRRYVILPDLELALWDLPRGERLSDPVAQPQRPPVPPRAAEPESSGEEIALKTVASRAAEEAERELVRRVLAETRWNRRETARRLKISYKALLNRLKRWDDEGSVG
jgi:two-component system response regulator AtoC